jgi:hypothetical protein
VREGGWNFFRLEENRGKSEVEFGGIGGIAGFFDGTFPERNGEIFLCP